MRHILYFTLLLTAAASCKPSKEELILKKWAATKVESPMLEKQIDEQKMFIDTIGTTTSADQNEKLYGVRNMDSMRVEMRKQLDLITGQQKEAIKNTWLHFNKDGTVAVNFGSSPDTVSWYFEDDSTLMLDEMKLKGTGSKIRMNVVKLQKDSLQLRFDENGFSSLATFQPAK
ncbi:MAG: hypothetical protein EOO01_08240 [Chitinophagaceae bacterium]|nr:MAG: hypothetical protein EOO01_08240 [Chitinophagaceae bacterium]